MPHQGAHGQVAGRIQRKAFILHQDVHPVNIIQFAQGRGNRQAVFVILAQLQLFRCAGQVHRAYAAADFNGMCAVQLQRFASAQGLRVRVTLIAE